MDDSLEQLELIARIQQAVARQAEGKAREAEAVERLHAGERDERQQLRAAADRKRQLHSFLHGGAAAEPIDLIVIDAEDEGDL